jgi:hypothetical protein
LMPIVRRRAAVFGLRGRRRIRELGGMAEI